MKAKLAILALTSILFTAYASSPRDTDTQAAAQESASAKQEGAATTSALTSTEISASELETKLQEMEKLSVYFDFDEYVIKAEYRDVVMQYAEFMKDHENTVITLEGNADERGSGEYNLSLGDKRASSVRKALELLGVPGNRVKAVSFGEERPRLTCHEERCWKENRRVDFIGKLN